MFSKNSAQDSTSDNEDQLLIAENRAALAKASARQLKEVFGQHLCRPESLQTPEGLPTGLGALDSFLLWGGLPKGALSLLQGSLGSGATSLWIECAARTLATGQAVAWIHHEIPLAPLALEHRGLDLKRFISFEIESSNDKKLFWLLQELMSSSLFSLIGCDLSTYKPARSPAQDFGTDFRGDIVSRHLKESQVRKLTALARTANVALVFLTPESMASRQQSLASVFSLILNFQKDHLLVERALHRPTPHSFTRSSQNARFTHHTRDRAGLSSDSLTTPGESPRLKSHFVP